MLIVSSCCRDRWAPCSGFWSVGGGHTRVKAKYHLPAPAGCRSCAHSYRPRPTTQPWSTLSSATSRFPTGSLPSNCARLSSTCSPSRARGWRWSDCGAQPRPVTITVKGLWRGAGEPCFKGEYRLLEPFAFRKTRKKNISIHGIP